MLIIISSQNNYIETILEEMNFRKTFKEIEYEICRFKNNVVAIISKNKCYYIYPNGRVELNKKMIFDEPSGLLKVKFEGHKINLNNDNTETIFLSNVISSKGSYYRIILFESPEIMNLIKGFMRGRIDYLLSSNICSEQDEPFLILENLVSCAII